jgi:hypothetical protein
MVNLGYNTAQLIEERLYVCVCVCVCARARALPGSSNHFPLAIFVHTGAQGPLNHRVFIASMFGK